MFREADARIRGREADGKRGSASVDTSALRATLMLGSVRRRHGSGRRRLLKRCLHRCMKTMYWRVE